MFFVWQASPRWSWLSPWASLRQKDTAPSPSECDFPRPRLQLIFILKSFLYRLKNLYPSSCLSFLPAAGCLWRADSSTLLSALPQLSFWYVLPVTVAVHHSFFFFYYYYPSAFYHFIIISSFCFFLVSETGEHGDWYSGFQQARVQGRHHRREAEGESRVGVLIFPRVFRLSPSSMPLRPY